MAIDRIGFRQRNTRDFLKRAVVFIYRFAVLVVFASSGISADHQEIVARRHSLVADAGRDHHDIACLYEKQPATDAAELNFPLPRAMPRTS